VTASSIIHQEHVNIVLVLAAGINDVEVYRLKRLRHG